MGTFRPIEVEDLSKHKMDAEYYAISEEACKIVNKAKEGGAAANLNSGSLTISGGTVTQNEAVQYGGVAISPCRVHNMYVIISS